MFQTEDSDWTPVTKFALMMTMDRTTAITGNAENTPGTGKKHWPSPVGVEMPS